MNDPTFHRFPNLPWELRRLVWEAAIRPAGRGIHSFAVATPEQVEGNPSPPRVLNYRNTDDDDDDDDVARYFATVPHFERSGRPNRSAYLWDAGLWLACKESRQAIARGLDINLRQLDVGKGPVVKQAGRARCQDHRPLPPPWLRNRGEGWPLVVRPHHDAVRVDGRGIHDRARAGPSSPAETLGRWRRIFSRFPLPALDFRLGAHLVVDFDSGWYEQWLRWGPVDVDDFYPQSFFVEALCVATSEWTRGNLARKETRVWLIDWGVYERDPYHQVAGGEVFYDCDGEYVEVGYGHLYMSVDPLSAAHFIIRLRPLETWTGYATPIFNHCKVLRPRKLVKPLK